MKNDTEKQSPGYIDFSKRYSDNIESRKLWRSRGPRMPHDVLVNLLFVAASILFLAGSLLNLFLR